MRGRLLPASAFVLGLVLALPAPARAGDVKLSIRDGRVALSAQDATLRQILLEWERVGGTRVFNRDRVPGTLLTIELTNVTEAAGARHAAPLGCGVRRHAAPGPICRRVAL